MIHAYQIYLDYDGIGSMIDIFKEFREAQEAYLNAEKVVEDEFEERMLMKIEPI